MTLFFAKFVFQVLGGNRHVIEVQFSSVQLKTNLVFVRDVSGLLFLHFNLQAEGTSVLLYVPGGGCFEPIPFSEKHAAQISQRRHSRVHPLTLYIVHDGRID